MDEDGSALIAVLVVILLFTLLMGSILAIDRLGARLVLGDVHAREALLAAEGGLELARARLRDDSAFQGDIRAIQLGNGSRASATVSAHGAYMRVVGRGQVGRRTAEVHALLGTEPSAPFQAALWIGDPHSGINVGGTTRITGRVVVGRAGYEESRFNRRGFTGAHTGEFVASDSTRLPEWSSGILDAWRAGREHSDKQGTAMEGSLRLDGERHLPTGTVISVSDTLFLDGRITGNELIFDAGEGIVLGPEFSGSGQFISDGFILVMGGARLIYPSLVLAANLRNDRPLTIHSGARVEGLIMAVPREPVAPGRGSPVVLEAGATIVGGIYSQVPLDVSGRVEGSVVTGQLQFYVSPTVYVNWLVDAEIDYDRRPHPFILPPGLNTQPSWTPVTRERRTRRLPAYSE